MIQLIQLMTTAVENCSNAKEDYYTVFHQLNKSIVYLFTV